MIYGKVIKKVYRKILFCIQPYSVQMRENTVQKRPVFTVVLCSDYLLKSDLNINNVTVLCRNLHGQYIFYFMRRFLLFHTIKLFVAFTKKIVDFSVTSAPLNLH